MELRQLEYFMAVCEELHFTKAAEKLNIAQPTLSQQIKSLEGYVGLPLFDRIGKKIALTEAGKILLSHCQRVFFELEQAEAAISDLNGLERGALNVGSLFTCTNYLLSPAILTYKHLYPNIKLSVLGLRTDEMIRKLLENKLDLGIGYLPVDHEDLVYVPLLTEELALVVSSNHSLAQLEAVDMHVLQNISTILLPKNYYLRQLIDQYCRQLQITLQPLMEMTPLESLIQMVSENIGATILPTPYIDTLNAPQLVKIRLLQPTPEREIGFIYRRNKFMCTATKSFIDQVREASQRIQSEAIQVVSIK